MKMKIIMGLMGIASLLTASLASAATVQFTPASLANANGTPVGDTFSLTVEGLNFDPLDPTVGGGFTLTWDPNIVTLVLPISFATIWDIPGVNGDPATGSIDVSVSTFGAPKSGNFTIADFTFSAAAAGSTPATLDFGLVQDNWVGSDYSTPLASQPTFTSATITVGAVPVPPAVWLFGSGLLGLVGVARRRQARAD